MSIFSAAFDFVGDVGFGVIKNSGRIAFGGGKAILGVVTEDETLIAEGLETMGQGAVGLGVAVTTNAIRGEDSEEDETIDPFGE
jgi:hypothetical protein